jgi:hypothetical protein
MEEIILESIPGLFYGGALGFFLFGAKKTFEQQRNKGQPLSFEPEAFAQDEDIALAYHRLQKFRHYAIKPFDKSGESVDSLLCIEMQLENEEVEPSLFQGTRARRHAATAKSELEEFQKHIIAKLFPREELRPEISKAKEEIKALKQRIDAHVLTVQSYFQNSDKRMNHPALPYPLHS